MDAALRILVIVPRWYHPISACGSTYTAARLRPTKHRLVANLPIRGTGSIRVGPSCVELLIFCYCRILLSRVGCPSHSRRAVCITPGVYCRVLQRRTGNSTRAPANTARGIRSTSGAVGVTITRVHTRAIFGLLGRHITLSSVRYRVHSNYRRARVDAGRAS